MPSSTKKQARFMAAVAHSPEFAKKAGVPQSVGKEFNQADKGRKFAGGGEMKESKAMVQKEVAFMKKKGAPKSMIKHEKAEYGMKAGGRIPSKGEHAVQKQSKRGAEMVKMAKGGLAGGHKAADGIAQRGKTKGAQPAMSKSKPLGMKKGGYC